MSEGGRAAAASIGVGFAERGDLKALGGGRGELMALPSGRRSDSEERRRQRSREACHPCVSGRTSR